MYGEYHIKEAITMIKRNIARFDVAGKKERYAVQQVRDFIESDKALDGNILILYGLRRTGKTTIMEQALSTYKDKELCEFYEIHEKDNMQDIYNIIIDSEKRGVNIICFDEITKAEDFIRDSALLADVFAKEGMRIIVTGTDSLSFNFATNRELYDRTIRIRTTHIPFAEHCEIFNTNDIDDYICFGGLMSKGKTEDEVHDYNSACKYLDSAVSENIVNSLNKNRHDSPLKKLSIKELQTIIEKMVELYSGQFEREDLQNELTKATITYPIKFLNNIIDKSITRPIISNSKQIVKEFVKAINADTEIKTIIDEEMINELKDYLRTLNVVSVTSTINLKFQEQIGWTSGREQYEYHIIQPALKYNHLQKGKDYIYNSSYYDKLLPIEQKYLTNKLEEKIYGDMLEQIVLFDINKALNVNLVRFDKPQYKVYKPSFFVNDQKKGEYDMLIYEVELNRYWGFEIKHTTMPFIDQEKHLQNEAFFPILEQNFVHRENVCVLYRGEPFFSEGSDTIYLNVADFLCSINHTHNIEKTISDLTQNIPTHKIPTEGIPDPMKSEITEQRRIYCIKENITNLNFLSAYSMYELNENKPISFMKEVVKIHGTNGDILKNAVESITNYENESQEFMAKIFNQTLKTEEYKEAFNAKKHNVNTSAR